MMVSKRGTDTMFPLSLSQMNIWNIEQKFSETSINNIGSALRIRGRLNLNTLEKSINILLEKNISLRIRITLIDGIPMQYYSDFKEQHFPVFDFSQTNRSGAVHWEEATARERMQLYNSPLCTFAIFKTGEEEGGVLIKTHHIISDGWSQVLTGNLLTDIYTRLLRGDNADDIEPLPAYSLHVESEQKYLNSSVYKRDELYWKNKLSEFEEPSFIKECKSAVISSVGHRKTYNFSSILSHEIDLFCKERRVAPFAVIYMALAVYLRRINGIERLGIGVPINNRADFNEKKMSGMFVSTLPFICSLDENWSFEEFNEHMTEEWYELLRHQKFPFTKITEIAGEKKLGPKLFNVALSYQDGSLFTDKEVSVIFEGRWYYSGYQAEDLVIHLSRFGEDGYSIDYDYLTQIFSREDIDMLHDYVVRILMSALYEPERPIWQLPLLGYDEKEKVLFSFNETTCYVREETVWTKFAKNANEYPERAALICGGVKMTYRELALRSFYYYMAVKDYLKNEKEQPVAVHLKKGFELIAAMLGISRAGHAWVIIASDTPKERRRTIIEDCGASLMICDNNYEENDEITKIIRVGDIANYGTDRETRENEDNDYEKISFNALAYIVYTSGSTGKPKGVEIEQRNLINFADAMRQLYGYGGVLSVCSTGFDAFMLESVSSILNGKTVVLAEENSDNPSALAALIKKYGVGVIAITPSRLRANMRNKSFLSSMRMLESIICGGEHLTGDLVQELKLYTGARIYNQYGPSETTVGVSWQLVNDEPVITIGRPMQNCRMYVLDSHLQPMPMGVYGDLYIGGMCVGRGYRNAEKMTEESFLPSPFESSERIYKTGDIACWSESGQIMLSGRKDSQVKLRGLRIEPQEIAIRIESHPAVLSAVCKVSEYQGQQIIVGYYTTDIDIAETEMLTFLSAYLPGYMIPAVLIHIDEMPVTVNGKIDLKKLPDPDIKVSEKSAENETERIILEIFRNTLKKQELDVESDYFLFGGDSLKAVETLSEIADELNVNLKVSDLYTFRTARRLAMLAGASELYSAEDEMTVGIGVAPLSDTYQLSPTQQSLYFQANIDPTGIAYNMPGIFMIPVSIDTERLKSSFVGLIENEDILRTSFVIENGHVVQKIALHVPFELEKMTQSDPTEARQAFVRPFDLSKAPLIRAAIWADETGTRFLFIDMHHIISDGISTPLMISRLDAIYRGEKPDNNLISYKDYVYWFENTRVKPVSQIEYWKKQLNKMPGRLDFPTDRPRPKLFDFNGASIDFELKNETTSLCADYCEKKGLSLFMLYAGVFAVLMSKITNSRDVVFGSPVSGRREKETWKIIGPFINTLPLRIRVENNINIKKYLEEVKDRVVEMLDNQDVSVEEIMHELHTERTFGQNSLYNVLFSYRPIEDTDITLGDSRLERMPLDSVSSKMDLSFEIYNENGRTGVRIEYASSLFNRDTIEVYSRSFCEILRSVLTDDSTAIDDIDPVAPYDRIRLIERPNRMSAPYMTNSIDCIIDEMAILCPDAPAVRFKGKAVTFSQFKQRSDSIAQQLIELGIKIGDCVAFACRRTESMLIGLTAILKAGACYMPMLDSFPTGRLNYMLETSDAKLVLCDNQTSVILSDKVSVPIKVMTGSDSMFTAPADRKMSDPIHILFTSGSTGKPKGAVISHNAISNLLTGLTPVLGDSRNVLCTTNVIFDTFITESLIALALGKCVIMADEEEMMLPWKVAELITSESVNFMQMTPSRLQMCLDNANFRSALSSVQTVIMAGEAVTPTLLEMLRKTGTGSIHNLYGPTEAAVYVTDGDITKNERPVIGKPLPNCRLYVLDSRLRHVMPGVPGELYIAGRCLADGYIKRPELTNESFIDDPFVSDAKMYKTGDLVKLLPDGNLEYAGRIDQQIKLNGQRIEPGEIEGQILNSGEASEAVVIPEKSEGRVMGLRAFIVAAAGIVPDLDRLRAYLTKNLPSYMIPSDFTLLKSLPRTASGKTDRKSLSEYKYHQSEQETTDVPEEELELTPQSDKLLDSFDSTEQIAAVNGDEPTFVDVTLDQMKEIWKEALNRSEIDETESFFNQGGTSLAALTVLTRYFDFGWVMTLSQFYENPVLLTQYTNLENTMSENEAERAEDTNKSAKVVELNRNIGIISSIGAERKAAVRQFSEAVISSLPLQNSGILITGATGFLGAHIVRELLETESGTVSCLVRGGDEKRLQENFRYYFGRAWTEKNKDRIICVAGDIGLKNLGMEKDVMLDMFLNTSKIIHAAADIRHFADEKESLAVNVSGTSNVIDFAEKCAASLYYISTVSVSGEYVIDTPEKRMKFCEKDADIGQNWRDNIYVRGKFTAENLVSEASKRGLNTKIFRIGRLVGRSTDGVFQKTPENNAFYGFIQGVSALQLLPEEFLNAPIELTSVDECAKAIVLLLDGEENVYHVMNPNAVQLRRIAASLGLIIDKTDDRSFVKHLAIGLRKASPSATAQFLEVWDRTRSGRIMIEPSADITVSELELKGMKWKEPDPAILLKEFAPARIQKEGISDKGASIR